MRPAFLLVFLCLCGAAQAAEISGFDLNVSNLDRSRAFYRDVLTFQEDPAAPGSTSDRASFLRLGADGRVTLREVPADRLVPRADAANDARFQHLAIVVSDIHAAFDRLTAQGVTLVSPAPQRLPDANPDAAGITALYFRDPDGHFLELIQYPSDKGEPRWHEKGAGLFLGIDHSAVAVADRDAAARFFRRAGLTQGGESHNRGLEQARLTGVPGADVRIVSLRGAAGPGVELIQYLAPPPAPGERPVSAHDWTIRLRTSALPAGNDRDPDGHPLAATPGDGSAVSDAAAAWRAHWTWYAMEAAMLGGFMAVSLWATLLFEHPASPARRRIASGALRRILIALPIGATVVLLIKSSWGHQTGAHFNPAVTLAFWSAGLIQPWDAAFYIAAQFVGGVVGLVLAALPFRKAARHSSVRYIVTQPRFGGPSASFVAEFLISFLLVAVLLCLRFSEFKTASPFVAGALVFGYAAFESPISGFGMNPARCAASALCMKDAAGLWIYFTAPVLGMAAAARIFGPA